MAEICISIASKVAEYLVDPILQPICYAFKYQRNMEELKRQVKKLTNERESVQHSVDEAKRQGDEIEKHVQEWLESVDEFAEEVAKPIIDDQVKVKKLCSIGFCPSLMTRYSLSKKAVKTAKDGVNLLGEGKFQKVSYPRRMGYEDFASRKSLSESIMEALVDADTNLIGVYGMGGVGKTTLVKKVAQQAKENKLFNLVVTAVVTETPDIKKIQDQIADELGLEFQQKSESGRAARLRERMKKENRMLVILDNVWAKLDLESIGIPIVGDEKGSIRQKVDQEEGENANKRQCKIVFTSRNLDVLRNDMDTQKNFKVEILSDPEAESLFWKTVGYSEEKSDLNPTAVEIVGKCGGLPVAIKTIANALKNKSPHVWKNALDQLIKVNPKDIKGMNAAVYSTIELSFNLLENEEAKSLFLFCSLCNTGYGVHITYLLKYSMGLSLFQDFYTLEEGRNKLHTLIDYLKTSCLLMDDDNDYVKMHDIIHAVAISISSTTKLWFNLQDAAGLKEALEKKLPKDSAAISLLYTDIYELPEKMEFPKLEQFLLYMEDASLQIPDAVFEGMKGLKVLDMTGIHLLSPPSSLCCLINLHTLCLDSCRLEDVAIIGELKELEILSFQDSDIEQLPREIGQLTRLRLLDLSDCSKLKVIKPNVISSLTRLEELYMGDSFDQWDIDGQRNASLAELKQLSYLTALDIHVPNAQIIPQDLSFGKLERYRIFIGEVWNWSGKYETSRTLKLKFSSSTYLSNEIKSLLNRTEDLHLDKLKGVKSVVYELSGEGFPQLKHLHVQNGSDIQYIANSFGWGLCNVFPRLESLFLDNLINLEKTCHAKLAPKSFSKLRIMKVRKCDRLEHLFSFSMVNNLSQLQEIEVTNCKKLEEIISKESMELVHQNESIRRIELTQVHTLTLECLPQLTSFSSSASTPDIGSQEIVAEDEADGFMSLFSQNVVLPSLKNLKLSSINIRCSWLDQLPVISSCCQALTNLTLQECNDLKFLFSYSMVQSLVQLQKLEIRNCKSIEGIINTEELSGKEKVIMIVFPKLLNLQLRDLPKLSRFGSGNSIEFLSLTQISIEECPKLKTFFDEKVSFSCLKKLILSELPKLLHLWKKNSQPSKVFENLESLEVSGCSNLKTLVPSSVSLQNLETLEVRNCDGLISLVTFSTAKSLEQLKRMEIIDCKLIEEIIIDTGDEKQDGIVFNQLEYLKLRDLPSLTSFCKGNFTMEFPYLQRVLVMECLNMMNFSQGVLSTPKLQSLQMTESIDEGCWEGDLNTTIQKFFRDMVGFRDIENFTVSEFPGLKELWYKKLLASYFSNLKSLVVDDKYCSLRYIFTPSVALGLAQLQDLEIKNCVVLEVITVIGEETISNTMFPNLNSLMLMDLPNLTCFSNFARNSIELPSLTRLSIENCPNMETFISNFLGVDMSTSKDNCHTDMQPLFDEKVGFPSLEKMVISGMDNLESIWHNQFLGDSFYKLKSVEINDCQELKTIFSSCICERLLWLESLTVKSCGSAIEIFDLRGINLKENLSIQTTPQLRELYVDHMSNLKHIWNEDPKGMLSFEKLEKVTVFLCPNLENLFPASVAKSLLNLDSLELSDCGVEEIIAKEGVKEAAADRFLFPQLSSLQLHNLPRLRTFYPRHTVEGPCLKRLGLHHCDISIHEQPPFFLVQEIEGTNQGFPNLEELQLSGKAMTTEWLDQIPENVFGSLKSLELNDDESTVLPLDFNQRFGSLEKLSLNSSSYKEIISYGKVKEHPEIKHLVLSGLFDLKQIWKQGSKIHLNFQNLEILEVRSCFNLINLMPSSASFQNLMILEVWGCDSLKNLLTSSTAKSLVLLEKLEVFDCKMLTEVVANDGAVREEIVFGKLKSLSLVYLQSLASFCSAKHTLNFPILESLVVNECPKMKIFSKGVTSTSTPKLHELELNWKAIEHSWEVGVNTTIQQNMERGLLGREDCTDPSTD